MTPIDNVFKILTTEMVANESKRLVIPYGQMMGILGEESKTANYLVFVQDDDAGDKRGSEWFLAFW